MITLSFIIAMFTGLIVQHFTGVVPGFGSQILLLPVIFLCGAAALPAWSMLCLAFVAGLMWDCLNFIPVEGRADFPFGGTILLYAGIGALMNGLRPLFLRGLWPIHAVVTGVLTSILVLVEFTLITFRREPFALIWPREIWQRVGGSGLVAAVLAVPLFLMLNWLGRRTGLFQPQRHARP
jgi:hypothetical protein